MKIDTNPALEAVTATASGTIPVNNYENITFQFIATGISSGNGVLTLLGSNDGVTFTAISFIDPTVANTNLQNFTRLLSVTLSANGSKIGAIDNAFKFAFLKFTATITTDGTYTVIACGDLKVRS